MTAARSAVSSFPGLRTLLEGGGPTRPRDRDSFQRAGGKIGAVDYPSRTSRRSIRGTVSTTPGRHSPSGDGLSVVGRLVGTHRCRMRCILSSRSGGVDPFTLGSVAWKPCPLFQRILIQDSTIIQFASNSFERFSGVKNQISPLSRPIQGVYDLCSGRFIQSPSTRTAE